jgi:long-chain acyl-CoA synthetase
MQDTLTSSFIEKIEKENPDKKIFFTKEDDEYIPFTNAEILDQVYSLTDYFKNLNLNKGDKIAIISENRTEWVVTDFACMFCGLISIPIYTSQSHAQLKYILENSGSVICFVSNLHQLEKVLQVADELKDLKLVVTYQEIEKDRYKLYNTEIVKSYTELISNEKNKNKRDSVRVDKIEHLKKLSSGTMKEDLVSIVYTSGTTGVPKGVMLMHQNYCSNVKACQKVLLINSEDIFLSYLPYSHSYERTAGYYLPFFCGAEIYYAVSFDTIAFQLTEVKPTFVITVPRLLDKFYSKVIKSGSDMEEGFKKKIFKWAISVAKNNEISKDSLKYKTADYLVFSKIREKTGGKIRYFVSGGGALNKDTAEFFDRTGIVILQGYGLTETSPVVSVNPPEKNKPDTVGKPIDGVKVKLSAENEILVSGELIMKGYYLDEKSTNETISDGWFSTGDIGEIDSDGYLKITDRKKALMKTSGGKYISPAYIENLVSGLSYIENIVVIGNERLYVTALIVPDRDELTDLANRNNIEYKLYNELLSNKVINSIIRKDIDKLQTVLAPYEKIKKFTLLEKHFSIESGELTPTLKVKRKVIDKDFKNEIEKMYF